MMSKIRRVSKFPPTVGLRKPVALAGSTATEMGMIGAVVLIVTLGFWFYLSDAVQYAFSFVRQDMVAQVSNANGMTPEEFEQKWKHSSTKDGDWGIDTDLPITTAGTNGSEDHAAIYKAMRELIDRNTRNGKMTEAQADTLSELVKQILLVTELEEAIYNAEADSGYYPEILSEMKVEFRGEIYLATDLATRLGLTLTVMEDYDELGDYAYFDYYTDETYQNSEYKTLDDLYDAADKNGLLEDSEIIDFLDQVWMSSYEY